MKLGSRIAVRIRCMRTRRILQNYCDGELDDASTNRVAAHIEECRRCGLEVSVYKDIKRSLQTKSKQVNPDALERLRVLAEQLANGGKTDGFDYDD